MEIAQQIGPMVFVVVALFAACKIFGAVLKNMAASRQVIRFDSMEQIPSGRNHFGEE